MRRERIGTYEVTSAGGEQVRAFTPAPLPPLPALDLDGTLQPGLESAVLALGRLDGISTLLPDRTFFLYYYELLNDVRRTGDWEAWLAFFIDGVRMTADGAATTSRRLLELFANDRATIEETGGRRAGSALRVYDALKAQPILSLPSAGARTGLAFRTTATAMALLVDLGIARETTGKRRGRLFVHDRYLAILNEGTEPFTQRYRRDDAAKENG